jgi:hypothetical protein
MKKKGQGGGSTAAFDAFSKVKKLPEVEAFSSFHSTRTFGVGAGAVEGGASDPYLAFGSNGSKTRNGTGEGGHDFPMSKRSSEDRPPTNERARGTRNPHLVFEPMTYGGVLLTPAMESTKKPTAVVVVSGGRSAASAVSTVTAEDDGSFAAKFANKMKIVEDPSYVPPPTVVDMESEQDFPTLGGPPKKVQGQVQGWTQKIQEATIATVSAIPAVPKKKKRAVKVLQEQVQDQENVQVQTTRLQVVPRHRIKKVQEEGKEGDEFKPIDYEEDAFDEDDVLESSDLDEEALFADDDGDEDDEEGDPAFGEARRYRDELY